jgi:hypothetical protein
MLAWAAQFLVNYFIERNAQRRRKSRCRFSVCRKGSKAHLPTRSSGELRFTALPVTNLKEVNNSRMLCCTEPHARQRARSHQRRRRSASLHISENGARGRAPGARRAKASSGERRGFARAYMRTPPPPPLPRSLSFVATQMLPAKNASRRTSAHESLASLFPLVRRERERDVNRCSNLRCCF